MAEAPTDSLINQEDGRKYWEGIDADVNGMLGGFPYISKIDLQGSRNFLAKLGIGTKEGLRTVTNCLEGGAGIGRITSGLLLDVAENVDVIEPVAKFTAELAGVAGVRDVFNVGLEAWAPPAGEGGVVYGLVWNQWCVGHLTDAQLVAYLGRCRDALDPDGGLIVVKENLSTGDGDIYDELDSSVTRQDDKFLQIFKAAELQLVRAEIQRGFPKDLYPVKMYALKR